MKQQGDEFRVLVCFDDVALDIYVGPHVFTVLLLTFLTKCRERR